MKINLRQIEVQLCVDTCTTVVLTCVQRLCWHAYNGCVDMCNSFLCSWARASWINVSNCPIRCDYIVYYISINCSACFGWWFHPSSGAHITNYSIWYWSDRLYYLPLSWSGWNCPTTTEGSGDGLTSARCCNYSHVLLMMGGITTRNVQSSLRKSNRLYVVASCWTITKNDSRCTNCVPTAPWQRKVADTVWPVPDAVIMIICAPDDGWNHHPKHVEQFTEI
jgi:hypothetical protein